MVEEVKRISLLEAKSGEVINTPRGFYLVVVQGQHISLIPVKVEYNRKYFIHDIQFNEKVEEDIGKIKALFNTKGYVKKVVKDEI